MVEVKSGIFRVQQIKPNEWPEMTFRIVEDKDETVSKMEVRLNEMEFESVKGEQHPLKFESVEHRESCQLKYFIKEKDVIFVRHGDSAYVQAAM